ncbi:MAG: hypothetical protein JNL69_10130 [Bacteroidia bacterium]|nr:hypothetical protein [Bacteroidia bacterium]
MLLKKKKVLLIYENEEESNTAEKYLANKGYKVGKVNSLDVAYEITIHFVPDLIVVNTQNPIQEIENFNKKVELEHNKKIDLLNIVDLESYLKISVNEHVAIKPVNPSLLYHLVRLIIKN